MRIDDITKNIEDMSDEELREELKKLRHRRSVEKPAVAKRKKKAAVKTARTRTKKVTNLLEGMSDADKLNLLKMLEGKVDEG